MSIDRIPLPRTSGSLWLCGRDDVAPDPEAALRFADGAGTIVCLNPIDELLPRHPDYVRWLRANAAGRALWYPVPNGRAPGAEHVLPLLRRIEERLVDGQGVVMHCTYGRGRAGTMAVALLLVLGMDEASAARTVAVHRTFAGPTSPTQWAFVAEIGRLVGG